ncbi:MAG: hypothetical protein ACXW0Q_12720 [Methylovulum sp.]
MAVTLQGYMGYENLSYEEFSIIASYFNSSEMSKEVVDKLLLSDIQLSKDMRRFIADVFTGRVTSKKMGRPSTTRRDKWIYKQVEDCLSAGFNLTSNKDDNGAVAEVAERMRLTEDVVLKAYQKIKTGEGYNDPLHYTRITRYDDDGVIMYDFIGDIL